MKDGLSGPAGSGRSVSVRRRMVLTSLLLPLLDACSAPLPAMRASGSTPGAQALLAASAQAHGAAALSGIRDVNVRYAGNWHGIVGTLQPALVDAGFRGGSEERLLLPDGLVSQAYSGPRGHKEVVRQSRPGGEGDVRVWFNGVEAEDRERRDAAALVADGYSLFLLGPILLAAHWAAERSLIMEVAAPQRVTVGGTERDCDVLRVRMTPGIGLSAGDDLAVFIDREERLMRRVRFTLNGLESTQGAVAEVDCWAHVPLQGVRWPTRFHEQLLRPLPLPVHEWRLEGLDLNRGLVPADVTGITLSPKAAAPAAALGTAASSGGE